MTRAETAGALARGETPDGVQVIKRGSARCVALVDGALLKVFTRDQRQAETEARALTTARARGLPVPELLDAGPDWVATRFLAGREARRDDLPAILPMVERMHEHGMLHRDLHVGNIWIHEGQPVLLDTHRARFLPYVPAILRRRELGYLAFSLGEPLPEELASCRFWRDLRAQRHWRSRTKRCVMESSGFTAFEGGYRRRDADPDALRAALAGIDDAEPIKLMERGRLYRSGPWILKEYPSPRMARKAWVGGHGLEMRGIRTGRGLAWSGRWLLMEDAGPTLSDWIEAHFADATGVERDELADTLADLLAALHRRGIYHRDLKANNICWTPGADPRLLDYDGVRFRRRVSTRRRIKNLAQLNAALPDVVPGPLRDRACARYLAESQLRGDPGGLRTAVIRASLRRHHHWSGCE